LVCFVEDEDEEVSGIMDLDCLDPGSITGGRGGRRSPRALSPVRGFRSPRSSSPARAASPSRQGRNRCLTYKHVWYLFVTTVLFMRIYVQFGSLLVAISRVLLEFIFIAFIHDEGRHTIRKVEIHKKHTLKHKNIQW